MTIDASNSQLNKPSQMMDGLFRSLQPDAQETLLIGAIPHILDDGIAQLLFPVSTESSIKTIQSFRLAEESRPGQIEYHPLARQYFLSLWQQQNPELFRQISRKLSEEYQRRVQESSSDSVANASEWMYHTLAADPADAIRLVLNFFHELIESRELGPAEHLIRLVEEQNPWIGEQITWVDYLKNALAFSHYQDVNTSLLNEFAGKQSNTLLAAYSSRLLGQVAIRERLWTDGRQFLEKARRTSTALDDLYLQALTYMNIGDLYQNLVESSGGILTEERQFRGSLHRIVYGLVRGPAALYSLASDYIDFLPKFYGMNYQNWVAIHFLRRARKHYRAAQQRFKQLANHRAEVEIYSRIAKVLLQLGHANRAHRICEVALQQTFVQNSPYYTAYFLSILGEIDRERKSIPGAQEKLADSLKTYEQYRDWNAAGHTALILGELYQESKDEELALNAYRRCLEAAIHSRDILLQSEVAFHLDSLIGQSSLTSSTHQDAQALRRSITQLAFIDRYPGPVQAVFRQLANRLIYPFIFLFVLVLFVGSGISMQILEGEIRIPDLPPLSAGDILLLLVGVFLPLLMIWLYQILYVFLGQLVMLSLSLGKVDQSQPNIFVLGEEAITHQDSQGKIKNQLAWNKIVYAVLDRRSLYMKPLAFSSSIDLYGSSKQVQLPATIFHYHELEHEVRRHIEQDRTVNIQSDVALLNLSWLAAALTLGSILSLVLVFGLQYYGCYDSSTDPKFVCPDSRILYAQPLIQYGLFFASVVFGALSLIRWKRADRFIRTAILHNAQQTKENT